MSTHSLRQLVYLLQSYRILFSVLLNPCQTPICASEVVGDDERINKINNTSTLFDILIERIWNTFHKTSKFKNLSLCSEGSFGLLVLYSFRTNMLNLGLNTREYIGLVWNTILIPTGFKLLIKLCLAFWPRGSNSYEKITKCIIMISTFTICII